MAEKIDYKRIISTALLTATTYAIVNYFSQPIKKKGLGVDIKMLAHLPPKEQARFADEVTIKNANNNVWLVEQFYNLDPNHPDIYKNINRTSIGNAAFLAVYSNNQEIKAKSLKILENLKIHV